MCRIELFAAIGLLMFLILNVFAGDARADGSLTGAFGSNGMAERNPNPVMRRPEGDGGIIKSIDSALNSADMKFSRKALVIGQRHAYGLGLCVGLCAKQQRELGIGLRFERKF